MGGRSCHGTKKDGECCGSCDAPDGALAQLTEEFRKAFEKCKSEEELAALRFQYLNANGIISRLLQNFSIDISNPEGFQDRVLAIFGFKTYVRTIFFINLFEKKIVEQWIAADGSSSDVMEVTDESVHKIVDEFMAERTEISPFELLGVYPKYFGPKSRIAEAWDGLGELSELEALKKAINLIKAESQIEALLYIASCAVMNILGADSSISWTDVGVYKTHMQFMDAISSCESNEEARALHNAYLGEEGVFAKRFAQFSHAELTNGNPTVAQWLALRDHVTMTFKELGVKAAKV